MGRIIGMVNVSDTKESIAKYDCLKTISSVSFDHTIYVDVANETAVITKYSNGQEEYCREVENIFALLMDKIHPDDASLMQREINKARKGEENLHFEVRLKESAGRRYRWHSVRMRRVMSEDSIIYAGASNYIDSRKNKENMLENKARQDSLTGLLNTGAVRDAICNYIKENPEKEAAMVLIDLDKFKKINDVFGHLTGDEILKAASIIIRRCFGINAIIGRIGGDEFLIFVKNLKGYSEIINFMGELKDQLMTARCGKDSNTYATCSAGIAIFPEMGTDYDTLFSLADKALYSVKDIGGNNYAIYSGELEKRDVLTHLVGNNEPILSLNDEESLYDFTTRVLANSKDVPTAIEIMLKRIQIDLDIDAIYINELDKKEMATVVTYESVRPGFPSRKGERIEFSHKAWKTAIDKHRNRNGLYIYDLRRPESEKAGSGLEQLEASASMISYEMQLLSKDIGVIEFVSRMGIPFWTPKKTQDLKAVAPLLSACVGQVRMSNSEENELENRENYDLLTGLMKEDMFMERAAEVIGRSGSSKRLAVVYSDIVNFKFLNDAYGYVFGDQILADVAGYLGSLEEVACAGRLSADYILRIDEYDKDCTNEEISKHINDVNEDISRFLRNKYGIGTIVVRSGVYIVPGNDSDINQSVSNANMARKIAKNNAFSKCVIFDQTMFERRKRQIEYIRDMESAIANNEFYVTMQPKVSGTDNRLVGAEALVRWRTMDGRYIYPDEFIPAFEKNGCIVDLDFFVYDKVMSYIHDRLAAGKKVVPISMNVSRMHFHTKDFTRRFKALLEKYQVPTEYLELEITESIYLENMKVFDDTLNELHRMGIKISMDDFGSGYSSLNALNDLRVDLLKIDKIFMHDPSLSENDKTIIRFIIDMAKNLNIKVLCEGVETDAQRLFLNSAGCELHQGYLYSKPVEIASFDKYMEDEELLFAKIS